MKPLIGSKPEDLDRAALIIQLVCQHFNCSTEDLETEGVRAAMFDWPRYIAIHLIRTNTSLTKSVIAALFNRRLPEIFAIEAPNAIARHWQRIAELNEIASRFSACWQQLQPA